MDTNEWALSPSVEDAGTGACRCLSAGTVLGSGDQDTNLLVSGASGVCQMG